jgi:DNA-binding MarR family transcriptional regulator
MPAKSARAKRTPAAKGANTADLADRLHSAAIHLLRRLRREDDASGLPAPQLSAMSVIVFGGPITLGALASAEQVRPPTITKLVAALEQQGLVERETDPQDRRVMRVKATARGARLLHDGRRRRVASLAASLGELAAADRAALARAIPMLEKVARAP